MNTHARFSFVAAALAVLAIASTAHAREGVKIGFRASPLKVQSDCLKAVGSVTSALAADKSEVLSIVAKEAEANPGCVCEIVKTSIVALKAPKKTVGSIVESAATAVPGSIELIVQCATAVAPDALTEINAAAARVQGDRPGDTGNPLDFPGEGDVGPMAGTDGGNSILRPGLQVEHPAAVDQPLDPTPVVSDPDPSINCNPPFPKVP